MNEHRRQILEMLSEGKINAEEAERLIAAAEQTSTSSVSHSPAASNGRPKYLRVQVDSEDSAGHDGPTKVNIRVPIQLLRAGVKLASLVPAGALRSANHAMQEQGFPIDLSQIKPDNLEELVDHLNDLTVDVDEKEAGNKVRVRVFCE